MFQDGVFLLMEMVKYSVLKFENYLSAVRDATEFTYVSERLTYNNIGCPT